MTPPCPRTPSFFALPSRYRVSGYVAGETLWSDGRAKPCDILGGVPDEPALTNLLTAAFLTLLAHTVLAFLLCTSLRALELYVALRETFHHRSRLPRGRARTPDPSPVPANVNLLSLLPALEC
jgi:hypothetical protein